MGNNNIGWITLATDSIIKTTNFFQTYGKQVTPVFATNIFALDTSIVYAGFNQVNIMKTTNGGGNIVSVEQISSEVPEKFYLYQNYPNPFNPNTKIKFQIPKPGYVILKVFDILGREIVTLIDKMMNAGVYDTEFDGANLSSGIYFYRIEAGNFVEAKKMVLVK